jgi:hypothetical protein
MFSFCQGSLSCWLLLLLLLLLGWHRMQQWQVHAGHSCLPFSTVAHPKVGVTPHTQTPSYSSGLALNDWTVSTTL